MSALSKIFFALFLALGISAHAGIFGSFRAPLLPAAGCPVLYKKLTHGENIPALWVVTHQTFDMVQKTLKELTEQPENANLPVLILNEDGPGYHPVKNKFAFNALDPRVYTQLLSRAAVHHSALGETEKLNVNATKIHLAGGNCGICLTHTVSHILLDFLESDRKEIHFVVHQSLIYPRFSERGAPLMRSLLAKELTRLHDRKPGIPVETTSLDEVNYTVTAKGHPGKKITFQLVP